MIKRVIAVVVAVTLVVGAWPRWGEATHVVTDLGTFNLTSSGVTKMSDATEKVRAGVQLMQYFGRWIGPVSLALFVAQTGLNIWDWYRHTFSPPATLPSPVTGGELNWGYAGGTVVFAYTAYTEAYRGAPWYYTGPLLVWSVDPSTIAWGKIVGMKTVPYSPAPYGLLYYSVYFYVQSTGGTWVNQFTGTNPTKDRDVAIAEMQQLRADIAAGAPLPAALVAAMTETGTDSSAVDARERAIQTINDAITVLNQGVGLSPSDVTVSGPGQSAAMPVASSSTGAGTQATTPASAVSSPAGGTDLTATNQKLDEIKSKLDTGNQTAGQMKDAAPNIAPGIECAACDRTQGWVALMQSWQAAAQGAPIFALIANLAWPGSGTVQRAWTLGSWNGHTLSVDLGSSGIDTVITVVRFVVIGGAVIVAYMIIFG